MSSRIDSPRQAAIFEKVIERTLSRIIKLRLGRVVSSTTEVINSLENVDVVLVVPDHPEDGVASGVPTRFERVPVLWPGSTAGGSIYFPVVAGDVVLLMFLDVDHGHWLAGSDDSTDDGQFPGFEIGRHGSANPVCIPIGKTVPSPYAGPVVTVGANAEPLLLGSVGATSPLVLPPTTDWLIAKLAHVVVALTKIQTALTALGVAPPVIATELAAISALDAAEPDDQFPFVTEKVRAE